MTAYQLRPVDAQVHAVQWTGSNTAEVAELVGEPTFECLLNEQGELQAHAVIIPTVEGPVRVNLTDWIVRWTSEGELARMTAAAFEAAYEPVPVEPEE